ncbi:MAG: DNA-3-methyladenine glycosylase [Candidatus Paceibacterota bacterium]
MSTILSKEWFQRPVLKVAPELLGQYLVLAREDGVERYCITEVEAYDGQNDLACHASKGRTARTEVMYREGGVFYVYLVYGMYHMLNIVTGERGYPSAVLIRGVEGFNGPGKLTRDLGIDRSIHGLPSIPDTGVWFEDSGIIIPENKIEKTPRIGVAYAGDWADKPYRFVYPGNKPERSSS